MKTCTRCRQSLPLSAFTKRSASPDGLMGHCRDCERARKQTDGPRPPRPESAKARHERFQREQWERDSEAYRRATSGPRFTRPAPAAPTRSDWTVPNYRDSAEQAAKRALCAKLLFGAEHTGSNANEAAAWHEKALLIKAKYAL